MLALLKILWVQTKHAVVVVTALKAGDSDFTNTKNILQISPMAAWLVQDYSLQNGLNVESVFASTINFGVCDTIICVFKYTVISTGGVQKTSFV
jgi:hypothetical protein